MSDTVRHYLAEHVPFFFFPLSEGTRGIVDIQAVEERWMNQVVIVALFSWSHSVARLEGEVDVPASPSCSGCSCRE